MEKTKGSLVIVGSGINTTCHLTQEAIARIKSAEKVLYVVGDPIGKNVISRLNPEAESMASFYEPGKPRMTTYEQMIARMVECVVAGLRTCGVFYGHPGVFAYPTHEAIRRLRSQGYQARMLPGISAEDCLFADLGVDPAQHGCQSYEATQLALYRYKLDPTVALVVWQPGAFAQHTYSAEEYDLSRLPELLAYLSEFYPLEHEVCVYEASIFPECEPRADWIPLRRLVEVPLTSASTMYVPPVRRAVPDPAALERLGLPLPTPPRSA